MPIKSGLMFINIEGVQDEDDDASKDGFSDRYQLELNTTIRVLSILNLDTPAILAQQQFTKNEWCILMTLFSNYPYYAPSENLLASLTSLSVEDCHKRIQEAQEEGFHALKRELKPVHRAISGIRTKFKHLSPQLQILLVRDAGYIFSFSSLDSLCKDRNFVKIVFSDKKADCS